MATAEPFVDQTSRAGDCPDRLHPLTESRDGLAMRLELTIRQVMHLEVANSTKCRTRELTTYLLLAVIRRDQEQAFQGVHVGTQSQICTGPQK